MKAVIILIKVLGIASLVYICVVAGIHGHQVYADHARSNPPVPAQPWVPPACEAKAFPPNSASCVQAYNPNNQ
jgi:hypothetical protein